MDKNPHAVALARLGARKGGLERARRLPRGRREEIARKAARERWKKYQASLRRTPAPEHVFIYGLAHPRTGKIRYVGRSHDPYKRWLWFLWRNNVTTLTAWVKRLAEQRLRPRLIYLEEVPTRQALAKEQEWIARLRAQGAALLNVIHGRAKMSLTPAQVRELMAKGLI